MTGVACLGSGFALSLSLCEFFTVAVFAGDIIRTQPTVKNPYPAGATFIFGQDENRA